MVTLELFQKYQFLFSKEFKDIKLIIQNGENDKSKSPGNKECDELFIDRLKRYPFALSMKKWETHFEWQNLLYDYPMIKGRILDFGCGSGHSDILLARNGKEVYGIDLSPIGIAIANYFKLKEPEEIKRKLTFECRDISSENNLGIKCDSAWSSHVFEHIENPGPILLGIKQYLKNDAPFLISVPFKNAYDDPGHVNHFYSTEDFKNWLKPHIWVEQVDINGKNQVLRALCYNK